MFADYIYHVFIVNDEEIKINDYGYAKNIKVVEDFIKTNYLNNLKKYMTFDEINNNDEFYTLKLSIPVIDKKDKMNEIEKISKMKFNVNFDNVNFNFNCVKKNYTEKTIFHCKFFGHKYIVRKYKISPIQLKCDSFVKQNLNVNNYLNNYSKIIIDTLLVKKLTHGCGQFINYFEDKSILKKYQQKYLNLCDYSYIDSNDTIIKKSDPKYIEHIEIMPKLKWFLSNHFVEKVIDWKFVSDNIELKNNFVITYDIIGCDSNDILDVMYVVNIE